MKKFVAVVRVKMDAYKGVQKPKKRKTHIIDDTDTPDVNNPVMYQQGQPSLNEATFQQLLTSIMKEKSGGEKSVDFNEILASGGGSVAHTIPSSQPISDESSDESSDDDEEELTKIYNAARATFPTEKEIKNAEISPVTSLELNKTYFILNGKKSAGTYYDDEGNIQKGNSLIIKCVQIESEDVSERMTVRLSGVTYKILMEDSQYEKYCESDEYYIKYVGTRESKMGRDYNVIKVLHREKGKKQWRIDGQPLHYRQELL